MQMNTINIIKQNTVITDCIDYEYRIWNMDLSDGQQGECSHWFQNLVQLYVNLWENEPTSHTI